MTDIKLCFLPQYFLSTAYISYVPWQCGYALLTVLLGHCDQLHHNKMKRVIALDIMKILMLVINNFGVSPIPRHSNGLFSEGIDTINDSEDVKFYCGLKSFVTNVFNGRLQVLD